MKSFVSFLFLVSYISTNFFAQSFVCNTPRNEDNRLKDGNSCTQFENFTLLKSSILPYTYSNCPIYTIKLKVHVMHFSITDPKNYTQNDVSDILAAVGFVNSFYSNIQAPSRPVLNPSMEETDTRIRFSCDANDVDFIVDPVGWDRYVSEPSQSLISIHSILNSQTLIINGQIPLITPNCLEILNSLNNNGIYQIQSSTYNTNTNQTQILFKSGSNLPTTANLSGQLRFYKDTDRNFFPDNYINHHNNDFNAIHIYLTSSSSKCYQVRFGGTSSPYWLNITTPNVQSGSLIGDGLWTFAKLLSHEIGHCLGLQHTDIPQFIDLPSTDVLAWAPCNSTLISNNIMGYNQCSDYLSPLQIAWIRKNLNENANLIQRVVESHQSNNNNVSITGTNVIWDQREIIGGTLTIESGSTLTVKCKVHFSPQGKVVIKPGGRLILDGGELTNILGEMWQGVEVWGTTSQHQYPLSQPLHQGKLEIKNGGIIENALIGVRNWKTNDYSKIGGVIIANDGVFKNNKKAVEFVIYENFSQTNPAVKMNNLSRFTNTDFIIDNDYLDDPTYFQYHITMWGVYGISYSNCHFFNNVSPKSYLANRNRAIYSIDAGYSINAGCSILVPNGSTCPESNLLKSTFTGFDKTIEATGTGTTKTVSVSQAIFDNNVSGVFFSELDNFSVNRSIMTLGNPSYSTSPSAYFGINTTNSTGYQIEENQFSKYTGINGTYGVSIANSGVENNRVYKNKFTDLTFGQALNGVNRNSADPLKGFQFLCNEFNGNTSRAVSVLVNNSTNGIRLYQGEFSPLKSAGNTFLNTPSNAFTIYNGTPNGIIYYHNNGTTIPTNNTTNVSLVATTVSNTCPSSFSIISGKQALQNHSDSLQVIYSDLKYNYLSLIDDGNTASFIDNIQNDWSETAWKLRNELIAKSPFVSEKSLLESVKQNILPNAMILEICLANPDVTKNQRFIEQLNTIYTLPEYMLNYIRENDEKTIRTTLEAQMGTISSEKSVVEDELIRLQATADERTIEDISNVYSLKTNSQQKIDLIELAIETENWQQASSMLNESLLDENLKDEHYRFNNYGDYIAFRSNLEGRKLSQLEPTEIQYLEDLALFENKVGGYARNILCFFYERCYENNNVDDSDKMLLIQTKPDKTLSELFYNFEIYPNPAAEYCSMKWEILDELKECAYIIYSIDGIEILRKGITSNQGEELIDTRNYKNGTYLIVIENNGIKKQIEKFIVSNK